MTRGNASIAWSWRHAIIESDLDAETRHVLLTLSVFMNERGGGCFPSIADLVAATGRSKNTVLARLKAAGDAGWLVISKHGFKGQRWKRSEYVAAWPERELTGDDCCEGGACGEPPSEGEKVVHLVDQGGSSGGSKVVHHVHQDKTSPVNTPVTVQFEREARERADAVSAEDSQPDSDQQAESPQAVERAFRKSFSAWPSFVSDSEPAARAEWQALDAAGRRAAGERMADYLAAAKAGGRKAVCSFAVYLRERRWEKLPEPEGGQEQPAHVEAKPFGKAWAAMRLARLLAGPDTAVVLSPFDRRLVDAGQADEAVLLRDAAARRGYQAVNFLHDRAADGKGAAAEARFAALGDGFEPVPVGSACWEAWAALHVARGWPWLPETGRQQVVYFPAGGPGGLADFEARLAESEARHADTGNGGNGRDRDDRGGRDEGGGAQGQVGS